MHSPEVLAFRVKSPFWRTLKFATGKKHRVHSSIIEVWHIEPGNKDALTVCQKRYKDKKGEWHYSKGWKWHFWHWQVSPSILYKWRRQLFTRCAECGGPSRKGNVVNHSDQGFGGSVKTPLWCGEVHLFHSECLSKITKARNDQLHNHEKASCYTCSGKDSFKINRNKKPAAKIAGELFGKK